MHSLISLVLIREKTVVLKARDENGNRRLTGGDEFRIELRGPTTIFGSITDSGNGMYRATYSTRTAGEYLIHITTSMSPCPQFTRYICEFIQLHTWVYIFYWLQPQVETFRVSFCRLNYFILDCIAYIHNTLCYVLTEHMSKTAWAPFRLQSTTVSIISPCFPSITGHICLRTFIWVGSEVCWVRHRLRGTRLRVAVLPQSGRCRATSPKVHGNGWWLL